MSAGQPTTAEHRDIARRHQRAKRPLTKLERVLALLRSRPICPFGHRGGLHDDEDGRANLQILLQLGLTRPDAIRVMPWISPSRIHAATWLQKRRGGA
jgi:hypothetical protein